MTDDQMNLAIIRQVMSLPDGHPARHSAATALGVIPRKPSEDAGGPWHGLPSIAAEAKAMGLQDQIAMDDPDYLEPCPPGACFFVSVNGLAACVHCGKLHTAPDSPVQREVEASGGEWPQTNGEGA